MTRLQLLLPAETSSSSSTLSSRSLSSSSLAIREFQSVFEPDDAINLENYRIYSKLLIDGMPSWPFSARTLQSTELAKFSS